MSVFSLSEVRNEQLKNYSDISDETIKTNFIYTAGGAGANPQHSNVIRFDPSTSHSEELNANCYSNGYYYRGLSNLKDMGYICARGPTANSLCSRFDFQTDHIQNSVNLTETRARGFTGNTPQYGYYFTGYRPSSPYASSTVDRIDYIAETISDIGDCPSSGYLGSACDMPNGVCFVNDGQHIRYFSGTNETFYDSGADIGNQDSNQNGISFSNTQFGYFCGGNYPPSPHPSNYHSIVNRIDFTNDAVQGFALPGIVTFGVGSASEDVGYCFGGYFNGTSATSHVNRYDFTADTFYNESHLPQTDMWQAVLKGGTKVNYKTNNQLYNNESVDLGYYGGGYNHTNWCKIDLSTELNSVSHTPKYSFNIRKIGSLSLNDAGYTAGGQLPPGPTINEMKKFDFVSETDKQISANLDLDTRYPSGIGHLKQNKGYFGGGYRDSTFIRVSNVDRIDGDTDTQSNITKLGMGALGMASSIDEKGDIGWFIGGKNFQPGGGPTNRTYDMAQKLDLSTESTSYDLRVGVKGFYHNNCQAQSETDAYLTGSDGPNTSNVMRWDYSTTTFVDTGANNARAKYYPEHVTTRSFSIDVAGYPYSSNNERLDFNTGTSSLTGQQTLSPGGNRRSMAVFTTSNRLRSVSQNNARDSRPGIDRRGNVAGATYGYFIGGENNSSYLTRNDRLDMMTDVVNTSTNAPTGSKVTCTEAHPSNYGYHMPGESPGGADNQINRFDFMNETFADVANFPHTAANNRPAMRTNESAYFVRTNGAGGVVKFDFTTDSFVSNLTQVGSNKYRSTNASTAKYGYSAGGGPNPTLNSDIERLDFNTDTFADTPSNLPSGAKNQGSHINGTIEGTCYFVGGYPETKVAVKMDIDTETTSDAGNVSHGGYNLVDSSTAQNNNFGYFGGGLNPSAPGGLVNQSRIEFSTDTTAANPVSNLTQSRYALDAFSNGR